MYWLGMVEIEYEQSVLLALKLRRYIKNKMMGLTDFLHLGTNPYKLKGN